MSSSQSQFHPPHLWAAGSLAAEFAPGELVDNRYQVVAPQIWRDTNPKEPPSLPDPTPTLAIAYLGLFGQSLHLPRLYGVCQLEEGEVMVLENVPLTPEGEFYPALEQAWADASPVRQVYWLWQILTLYQPLTQEGVVSSLLDWDNIRVQGWRVRLKQLFLDSETNPPPELLQSSLTPPSESATLVQAPIDIYLQKLGAIWEPVVRSAKAAVAPQLEAIARQLQTSEVSLEKVSATLNQLLLEQAAQQPLRIQVASASDTGPKRSHNEDSYYPTAKEIDNRFLQSPPILAEHLAIVCDGIGGHEGGEVASQLAVQSLKLQVQALLKEISTDPEIMTPDLVAEQLAAIVRIANNLIAARNDEQEREWRQRMGTTLIMAVQLPQQIKNLELGVGNSHELYLVNVGDSKAYWITPEACYPLTVDDDLASRETTLARSLYREALQHQGAGALTQALGTKDAESLRPTVQRLILEEDGLLLLCSDGLSDNNLLEQYWAYFCPNVLNGEQTLEEAVRSLIDLANEKNGHDNTSVVLVSYGISPQYPVLVNLSELPQFSLVSSKSGEPNSAEASEGSAEEAELELEPEDQPLVEVNHRSRLKILVIFLGVLALVASAALGGLMLSKVLLDSDSSIPSSPPENAE
ncbi:PP2C family protein-serine/threonine phosphatase [Oscillatoria salina]|uniref:PP2C family protein-serine/threonine phosphatase n=1 Tax=Oscillatoria salina TaxID=331517 RepID=UPI001CCE948F|nr:protein phosphatase 2C domain-containing protein [Oscillatoria salina]MBZ8181348.1 serine/threonine-protein phosphatase [Oscillatoria salina IIICB1]